tara:strand:- start:938 stop:1204 length:267 start_codon:yes stop_codon:yes gene_type:complete
LVSTYLGTLLVNPLNSSFIYFLHYKLGSFIVGNNVGVTLPITSHDIKYIAKQIYIGGFIIALIMAFLIYFLLYVAITYFRKKKLKMEG